MTYFLPYLLTYLLTHLLTYFLTFVSQIENTNLPGKCLISYDVTGISTSIPPQETIDVAIHFIFNSNPNLNITKKELKTFSFLLHPGLIFFLTVNFIIELMQ